MCLCSPSSLFGLATLALSSCACRDNDLTTRGRVLKCLNVDTPNILFECRPRQRISPLGTAYLTLHCSNTPTVCSWPAFHGPYQPCLHCRDDEQASCRQGVLKEKLRVKRRQFFLLSKRSSHGRTAKLNPTQHTGSSCRLRQE